MKFMNYVTLVCILTAVCFFVVSCERTQQTLMDSIVMPSDTDMTEVDAAGDEMSGETSETTEMDDSGDEMSGGTSETTDTQ